MNGNNKYWQVHVPNYGDESGKYNLFTIPATSDFIHEIAESVHQRRPDRQLNFEVTSDFPNSPYITLTAKSFIAAGTDTALQLLN